MAWGGLGVGLLGWVLLPNVQGLSVLHQGAVWQGSLFLVGRANAPSFHVADFYANGGYIP